MTANASARAIKPELLRTYTEDFNKDRANLIAADAAVSAGVLKAATDYRGVRALPRDFSIELKQGSITKLVCSYPNGINFTYRTKAACKLEDDKACAAGAANCRATCD
mgnify:FL=1